MKKKKILYIMHIPWGWIKQRPHFIAEYLSKYFSIDVKHRHSNKINQQHLINRIPNNTMDLKIKGYRLITFEKLPIIKYLKLEWINSVLFRFAINRFDKYDYIWVTSPLIYKYMIKTQSKIIYDCMDDFLEFPEVKNDNKIRSKFFHLEEKLFANADVVFCSSSHLSDVLKKRYNNNRDVYIVNNAVNLDENQVKSTNLNDDLLQKIKQIKNPFIYIGTIASWFDFDSVLALLDNNKSVNVLLFGPIGSTKVPIHSRLHVMGSIEHKYVFEIMKYAKALIMPFKVNDLILSVNPVKLYEYIYSGKPIIATRYKEAEKFSDYVFLYENKEEFIGYANSIIDGLELKVTQKEMRKYALQNTWESRTEEIKKYLKKLE